MQGQDVPQTVPQTVPQIGSKTGKIDAAMAQIKSALTAVKKDGTNPHFGNNFASLNAHLKAVEPLVKKAGCILTQPTFLDARTGLNVQLTRITHVDSGQSVEASLSLGEQKDMQKVGSAITYARRYTLGALLGMQAEDDDGNTASGKAVVKPRARNKGDF